MTDSVRQVHRKTDYAKRFVEQLLLNKDSRRRFQKLCKAGCDQGDLGKLLFATCVLARNSAFNNSLRSFPGVSTKELKTLPRRLRDLADLLKIVNKSAMSPPRYLRWAGSGKETEQGDPSRRHLVQLFELLPGLMIVFAEALDNISSKSKRMLKRLTPARYQAMELLIYVWAQTKAHYYEDLASLLQAGFSLDGSTSASLPRFFESSALSKLFQRRPVAKLLSSSR